MEPLTAGLGLLGGGALLSGLGGLFGASAAKKRQRELARIANLPGVSLSDVQGEAGAAMGGAESLEARRNAFARQQMKEMLGDTIPGYEEGQEQRTRTALSLMRGEVPADVQEMISRSAASRAVGGGFGGSQFGRNLAARDLGRTSLDLMNLGGQQFAGILGTTPRPEMASYAMSPAQILALRSQERSQKLGMLSGAAQAPGATDVAAAGLGSAGGGILGLGGLLAGQALFGKKG